MPSIARMMTITILPSPWLRGKTLMMMIHLMDLLISSMAWRPWPKRRKHLSRRCTHHANKVNAPPSSSKGETWIPSIPPGKEDVSQTYFRDLLEAQMKTPYKDKEISPHLLSPFVILQVRSSMTTSPHLQKLLSQPQTWKSRTT